MAQQHSQFIDIVNRVLWNCGYTAIPDADTFADENQLEKPQNQAKWYVYDANQKLLRRMSELFSQRGPYNLSTQNGVSDYDITSDSSVESIMWHTFRVMTTGFVRRLEYITWNDYRMLYPDPTLIIPTCPIYWTDILTSPSSDVRTNQIRLVPTPDAGPDGQGYILEYSAKLDAAPLKLATDKILWPPVYEDVLVTWGEALLKRQLKVDDMGAYAEAAVNAVKAWATGPVERPLSLSFGDTRIYGPRKHDGYYWGPAYGWW